MCRAFLVKYLPCRLNIGGEFEIPLGYVSSNIIHTTALFLILFRSVVGFSSKTTVFIDFWKIWCLKNTQTPPKKTFRPEHIDRWMQHGHLPLVNPIRFSPSPLWGLRFRVKNGYFSVSIPRTVCACNNNNVRTIVITSSSKSGIVRTYICTSYRVR